MATIKNISTGPRGAYAAGVLVMAEAGQIIEADDYAEEWFVPTKAQLDHDGDGNPGGSKPHNPPGLTGKTKAQLVEIAEAEGVELEDDMTVADIRSAIELKREA
ncbi:hypothetical protein [Sphingomonas sp.]|uniref:hypothetical protein n=1 Tax=Sphingomonas sp. TaxID=28214 RepID=UPI003F727C5F